MYELAEEVLGSLAYNPDEIRLFITHLPEFKDRHVYRYSGIFLSTLIRNCSGDRIILELGEEGGGRQEVYSLPQPFLHHR